MRYATVWRWHFYAGLFSIPFILWLACTGALYLWKPQIERLIDWPYDHIAPSGPPAAMSDQVRAALAAVPGSTLKAVELPRSASAATRILVSHGGEAVRVYVDPQTTAILKQAGEDDRLMSIVSKLHGELLVGNWGSHLVELAASWAIVLILTGLYLWWPRGTRGPAGVLYPRLRAGGRRFWRDLHAVIGVWISAFALFLLVSGLPWTAGWGSYLKQLRSFDGISAKPDWPVGAGGGADHAGHAGMDAMRPSTAIRNYTEIDRLVPAAGRFALAPPVLLVPPAMPGMAWTVKSDAQNRPLRATLTLDPATGRLLTRQDFGDRPLVDRVVGYGVAAHEGQLFGLANQLLGLFTAIGLVAIAVSGAVMWWRRRPPGTLGAPPGAGGRTVGAGLAGLILLIGVLLPSFGISLLLVLAAELMLFRRIPGVSRWLGLRTAG